MCLIYLISDLIMNNVWMCVRFLAGSKFVGLVTVIISHYTEPATHSSTSLQEAVSSTPDRTTLRSSGVLSI